MKITVILDNKQEKALIRITNAENRKRKAFSPDPTVYLDITPEEYFIERTTAFLQDEVAGMDASEIKAKTQELATKILAAPANKRDAVFAAAEIELARAGALPPK